jgi:hypothetical protein
MGWFSFTDRSASDNKHIVDSTVNDDTTVADSSNEAKGNKICVNCRPAPAEVAAPLLDAQGGSVVAPGGPCHEVYKQVSLCNREHEGRIAPCALEWQRFAACHQQYNDNVHSTTDSMTE